MMIPATRKKAIPNPMALITFIPSHSGTRRSPGFPARARFFSVLDVKEVEVKRVAVPERRPASGRTVRSKNGSLELELLEVLRLHRPELGEAGLDRVDRRSAGQADRDQENREGGGAGDQDGDQGFHALHLDVDDAPDEDEAR